MRKPGKSASMYLCFAAVVLLAFSLNVGCGDDDDDNPTGPSPFISADWVGVWEQSVTMTICGEQTSYMSFTDTMTICPDEEDWVQEDDPNVDCDYTWDGNTMSSTCTIVDTTDECIVTVDVSYTGTVTGTSYNMSGTIQNTYSGTGCPTGGYDCMNITYTGTRIGDAPDPCDPFGGTSSGEDVFTYTVTNGGTADYAFSDNEVVVLLSEGGYSIIAGAGTVDGHTIYFYTPTPTAANNYGLAGWTEATANQVGANYVTPDGSMLTDANGTMLVTEADASHIAGTFSFTATLSDGVSTEDITVSSGVFDVLVDVAGKTDQIPDSAKAFRARLLGMIR